MVYIQIFRYLSLISPAVLFELVDAYRIRQRVCDEPGQKVNGIDASKRPRPMLPTPGKHRGSES